LTKLRPQFRGFVFLEHGVNINSTIHLDRGRRDDETESPIDQNDVRRLAVDGPRVWNSLPASIHGPTISITVFF